MQKSSGLEWFRFVPCYRILNVWLISLRSHSGLPLPTQYGLGQALTAERARLFIPCGGVRFLIKTRKKPKIKKKTDEFKTILRILPRYLQSSLE